MNPKLLLATPAYGGMVTTEYLQSMLVLGKTDLAFDHMVIANESLVSRGRNSCVATFLGGESWTHLLFVDADIGFRPEAVARLLQHGGDVVAGVYPKKKLNWAKAAATGRVEPDELPFSTLDYVLNVREEGESLPGERFDGVVTEGWMRVAYAGTGFMLIRRRVFDLLRDRFPGDRYADDGDGYDRSSLKGNFWNFFEPLVHPQSRRYLSEDFGFCWKWRQCGGQIHVDCTSRLSHTGQHVFRGDVARLRRELPLAQSA